jgi:hypothetical protein
MSSVAASGTGSGSPLRLNSRPASVARMMGLRASARVIPHALASPLPHTASATTAMTFTTGRQIASASITIAVVSGGNSSAATASPK